MYRNQRQVVFALLISTCVGCVREPAPAEPASMGEMMAAEQDMSALTDSDLEPDLPEDFGRVDDMSSADMLSPSTMDMGSEDVSDLDEMGASGPKLGEPAPPGPTPDLDPNHPLRDMPPVERVMGDVLIASIEHLQWLPDTSQLWFSLCKGGRGSVEKLSSEAFAADPDAQEHPYSMWTYQEFVDGPRAWESMRLPAHPNGRGETNWCRKALSTGERWCHHNFKKGNEWVIRVDSGDGITAPIERTRWDLKGQHSGVYTYVETASDRVYWVFKSGIGSGKSWIGVTDLGALPPEGDDIMTRVSSPCEDQPDGTRICDPPQDIYGLAISPDEQTLYFTTGGWHTQDNDGALWKASIEPDGTLGEEQVLVGDVPRARGMTIDALGNLYVASGLEVRVYDPLGQSLGVIDVVVDPTHRADLESGGGERFTVLSVAFGGPHFNVLYISVGYDRRGTENIDQPVLHTLGGLFRVPLKTTGAWVDRFGVESP